MSKIGKSWYVESIPITLILRFVLYSVYFRFFRTSQFLTRDLLTLKNTLPISHTRGSLFCSGKVFEGVHSHVMDLLRKSDFAPLNFLFKSYDHVSKSDFAPFFDRISDFGPDSYFESKLEQNRKFELLKSGAKLDFGT